VTKCKFTKLQYLLGYWSPVGNNRSLDSNRSIDLPFPSEHVQWELSMRSENYDVHLFQREKEDYL
jgi:hypothetical protein